MVLEEMLSGPLNSQWKYPWMFPNKLLYFFAQYLMKVSVQFKQTNHKLNLLSQIEFVHRFCIIYKNVKITAMDLQPTQNCVEEMGFNVQFCSFSFLPGIDTLFHWMTCYRLVLGWCTQSTCQHMSSCQGVLDAIVCRVSHPNCTEQTRRGGWRGTGQHGRSDRRHDGGGR